MYNLMHLFSARNEAQLIVKLKGKRGRGYQLGKASM